MEAVALCERETKVLGKLGDGAIAESFAIDKDTITIKNDQVRGGQDFIVVSAAQGANWAGGSVRQARGWERPPAVDLRRAQYQ